MVQSGVGAYLLWVFDVITIVICIFVDTTNECVFCGMRRNRVFGGCGLSRLFVVVVFSSVFLFLVFVDTIGIGWFFPCIVWSFGGWCCRRFFVVCVDFSGVVLDGNVRSVGVGLFLVVVGLGLCASCAVSSVVCRVVYVCEYWLGAGDSVVGWLHVVIRTSLVQFPCWYGWVCVRGACDGGR